MSDEVRVRILSGRHIGKTGELTSLEGDVAIVLLDSGTEVEVAPDNVQTIENTQPTLNVAARLEQMDEAEGGLNLLKDLHNLPDAPQEESLSNGHPPTAPEGVDVQALARQIAALKAAGVSIPGFRIAPTGPQQRKHAAMVMDSFSITAEEIEKLKGLAATMNVPRAALCRAAVRFFMSLTGEEQGGIVSKFGDKY